MARILLLGLESAMADELSRVLCQLGQNVQTVASDSGDAIFGDIQLIFAPEADLVSTQRKRPGVPVIVVSRLPEVSSWLRALEHGAADLLDRGRQLWREERWIRRSTTRPSIAPLAGLVVEIGHSVAAPYAGMVSLRRP